MKGTGRRGEVTVFLATPLNRTPGRFGRLTAEVEPGAAKQEGEYFPVFTCVFPLLPGFLYMAAGLSPGSGSRRGSLRVIWEQSLGRTYGTPCYPRGSNAFEVHSPTTLHL